MADNTSHERTLTPAIKTAAILARGLGSRMRRDDATATASDAQSKVAETGVKGMIPIKRPFLEYVISALADAGLSEVVLVLGPEHDAVRRHFTVDVPPTRVRIRFGLQEEPRGTADAVRAAADVIGNSPGGRSYDRCASNAGRSTRSDRGVGINYRVGAAPRGEISAVPIRMSNGPLSRTAA